LRSAVVAAAQALQVYKQAALADRAVERPADHFLVVLQQEIVYHLAAAMLAATELEYLLMIKPVVEAAQAAPADRVPVQLLLIKTVKVDQVFHLV
jgi:hypothetical protein